MSRGTDAELAAEDAALNDFDHCPKCGMAWSWDGETEQSRICPPCTMGE